MAKNDFGSARYQLKQLKASGLQKLRFYCQICLKQCRDANGFKMHLGSPSHLGRISNLSKDGKGGSVVHEFLGRFEREFLRLLRINHGTKKINANKFYQEYILSDKDHVHMNATKWNSLTAFVKYLGQLGKVRVEIPEDSPDEFNLVIRLVDASTDAKGEERAKSLRTDEERHMKFLQSQIDAGKQLESTVSPPASVESSGAVEPTEKPAAKPVSVSLKGLTTKKARPAAAFGNDSDDE